MQCNVVKVLLQSTQIELFRFSRQLFLFNLIEFRFFDLHHCKAGSKMIFHKILSQNWFDEISHCNLTKLRHRNIFDFTSFLTFFFAAGATISKFQNWGFVISTWMFRPSWLFIFYWIFLIFLTKKPRLSLQISPGKAQNWVHRVHWSLISILAQKTRHKLVKNHTFLTNFQELQTTRLSLFTFQPLSGGGVPFILY